jgi:hypothetical protein
LLSLLFAVPSAAVLTAALSGLVLVVTVVMLLLVTAVMRRLLLTMLRLLERELLAAFCAAFAAGGHVKQTVVSLYSAIMYVCTTRKKYKHKYRLKQTECTPSLLQLQIFIISYLLLHCLRVQTLSCTP